LKDGEATADVIRELIRLASGVAWTLREALDWLRDTSAELFEQEAKSF